jgi:hypothetical protein
MRNCQHYVAIIWRDKVEAMLWMLFVLQSDITFRKCFIGDQLLASHSLCVPLELHCSNVLSPCFSPAYEEIEVFMDELCLLFCSVDIYHYKLFVSI